MIKTYKEQKAIFIHTNMHSSQPSFPLLLQYWMCACAPGEQDMIRKTWACHFNDSINMHTIFHIGRWINTVSYCAGYV